MVHREEAQELISRGALFIINHSGGKDSQCMLAVLRGFIPESQILVVYANVKGQEWNGTREHIESTLGSLKFKRVSANKTFFGMVRNRGMWPGAKHRQCTSDLKRDPIEKEIRSHIKENSLSGLIVNCMGIRAQESHARAKQIPFKLSKRNSKAGREWYNWYPIFEYKEGEVFDAISAAGEKPHYAYDLGMTRLSCCFCILASRNDVTVAREHNPELFEEICTIEKEIGHTMRMDKGSPIGLAEFIDN